MPKQICQIGFAIVVMCLVVPSAGAANFVWTGASSVNWSDGANWTNGTPPTASGSDNVVLMAGANPPANQDIAGLSIDTLNFNTNTAGYTINGSPITLKKISSTDDGVNYQTNMLNCDVVISANNDWDIYGKTYVWINGALGETNGSKRLSGWRTKEGTLVLTGSNTFSGGINNYQITVIVYHDGNLGTVPASTVSNCLESGNGRWRVVSTGRFNCVTLPATRGLAPGGGASLSAEANSKIIVNGPITGTSGIRFGESHHGMPGSGTIVLKGDSAGFRGNVSLDGGTVILMHSNALGSVTTGSMTAGGSHDFHGFNSERGIPSIWTGSGVDGSGVLKNNDPLNPSTLSGDFGLTYSDCMPFGGSGDLIVSGILSSSGSGRLRKTGSGTLILKGANTFTAESDIHMGGLTLDYTVQNNDKIGTNNLVYLTQAALKLVGSDSGDSSQRAGSLLIGGEVNIPAGATSITLQPGLNRNLTLAALGVVVAGQNSVDIRTISNGSGSTQITTTNADGLLGGISATWNGYTLAKVAGGVVTGMADGEYLTSFSGGTTSSHVDVPGGGTTLNASATAQTLRFNASAGSALTIASGQTLTLNGINGPSIAMRPGILVTSNSGPVSLDGPGGIEPGHNQCFFIHQYSTNPMTIGAQFSGQFLNAVWCKTGPGELILTGTNANVGATLIHGGTLTATTLGSNGVSSSIGQAQQIYMANSTFKYIGGRSVHNRQISMRGPAAIDASGSGLLEFTTATNVAVVVDGRDYPLTLTGSGSGQMDGLLDLHLGSVIKTGAGSWTIGGAQTYTGDTIVSNGTLRLTNNCILARSLTVTPAGTLAGSGTVCESLVMQGTRRIELRSDVDYDTLTVGNDVSIGGTLQVVEMNGYKMPANLPLCILSAGGVLTGGFASVSGGTFTVAASADGRGLVLSKRYPGFIFYVQ